MNERTDNQNLLAEVLAEASSADFRAEMLAETLRLARKSLDEARTASAHAEREEARITARRTRLEEAAGSRYLELQDRLSATKIGALTRWRSLPLGC